MRLAFALTQLALGMSVPTSIGEVNGGDPINRNALVFDGDDLDMEISRIIEPTLAKNIVPLAMEQDLTGINVGSPQSEMAVVHSREAFPQWLHELTGLSQWPNENPPYIPMATVNLSIVPNDIPQRGLGDCTGIEHSHCSFDCYRCIAVEELATCSNISQTFDDGPSPSTPKLLSELKGRTTFFTQGINVIRFPNIFRQQHAAGHLLATHTWSHANLPGLTNEEIAAQIQWSVWAMNATAGIIPRYFRPPYGAIDDRVRAVTRQFGLVAVFWDKDTYDWRLNDNSKTQDEVFNDVRRWQVEAPAALLLEHDSTIKTVNAGIQISGLLGNNQMTVAECAGGPWYQNQAGPTPSTFKSNGDK